jgi:hypothetical protein
MNKPRRYCNSCREFPLEASMKSGGVAECASWQRPANWNDEYCILHVPAADLTQRRNLVIQLMKEEK